MSAERAVAEQARIDAARVGVKVAVEEWFTDVDLDDLFDVKGWGQVTAPDYADLRRLLAAHAQATGIRDLRQHCSCGWKSVERVGVATHRAHVAEQIGAALLDEREALIRERDEARAKVKAVESLADRWEGYGHGRYNIHAKDGDGGFYCPACQALAELRAALADDGTP